MLRNIILVFCLVFSRFAFADFGDTNRVLFAVGGAGNLDWYAAPEFKKPVSSIANGPVKLQARFVWTGPAGTVWEGDDHAIVMYGQGSNPYALNSPLQPQPPLQEPQDRTMWTYGVGAFVGSSGLNLELWFGPSSAYVWNKDFLCGRGVKAPDPQGICLSPFVNISNTNHVTQLPAGWKIKHGVPYWVRIKIVQDTDPGNARLHAELFEEAQPGYAVSLQSASIRLIKAAFLPYGENMRGIVARAPGTGVNISYDAFDYGF